MKTACLVLDPFGWLLVGFQLICGHKSPVIRALFSSTVMLRAVCFTSEPFSEDSAVLSLLQRPQAVLMLLSSAFPATLKAAQ